MALLKDELFDFATQFGLHDDLCAYPLYIFNVISHLHLNRAMLCDASQDQESPPGSLWATSRSFGLVEKY